jgi:hypothetical protein
MGTGWLRAVDLSTSGADRSGAEPANTDSASL